MAFTLLTIRELEPTEIVSQCHTYSSTLTSQTLWGEQS